MKSAYMPLFLLLFGCRAAVIAADSPATQVSVDEPPAPKAWTPPETSLPKAKVEEAAFLLAHGMGDPRGGTYREASVVVGSVWGQGEKSTKLHGWVLPGDRWFVAPNGLVYDVVALGPKASLQADVAARGEKPARGGFFGRSTPRLGPESVPVLLVAGETKLAEHLAITPTVGRGGPEGGFLAALFDQAVTAHMRGDDRTALRVGRLLARVRPEFDARYAAAVDPRTGAGPDGGIRREGAYAFLDPVPALVRDSERRLALPPRGPFDPQKATVAQLIDRLDEVSARQMGQPGGVNLADDPVVAALGAKGDAAAEPLLDAMEGDARLTRSVSFGRDFFPTRNLIPVRSAALAAFQIFAQTDAFPAGGGPQLDVKGLRAYWKANAGKSLPDRWFDTLADDAAGWRRWEDAAQRLFDGRNVQRQGTWTTVPPDEGPINAEGVRARRDPSLSDLLARRALDVVDRNNDGLGGPLMYTTGIRLGLDLAQWDPPRAIPVLRDLTRRSIEALANQRMMDDYAGTFVVPAIEARAKAGDATAWRDYADLLRAVRHFPSFDSKLLRPMVEHRDVPEVREATKLLFQPGSIYNSLERYRTEPGLAGYDPIVVSPLLELPEFRAAVLRALDDRATIGASWIDDRGNGWMEVGGKPSASQGVRPDPKDPKPKAGERRPLRSADVVAHALARLEGAPKFQPFWTVREKDAAISRMGAFLRANAKRIDEVVPWPNDWTDGMEHMRKMEQRRKAAEKPG